MPDLHQEAWNTGFPTTEVTPQELILPEMRTAALKPSEVEVVAESEVDETSARSERPGRSDGSKEEPPVETQTAEVRTEPVRTERPAPKSEPVRERETKERDRDDEERSSSGRGNR